MEKQNLMAYIYEKQLQLEKDLAKYIKTIKAPSLLKESMLYSLEAGGKRLRPILLFATVEGYGKDFRVALPVACAIEMIHTYSLIHDDLPAMDNDDYRRGKPTNHKIFGDAMAILAGDALLTFAFQTIATMQKGEINELQKLLLISELALAAGPEGMVGGQVADIEGENKQLSLEELEFIHHHKTGDLLSYSIIAGAIIADADMEDYINLKQFSTHLGLAFQIKDDILDVEGIAENIGKPIGSDVNNEKSTYPKILGMDMAKRELDNHISEAKEYLYRVKMDYTKLEKLTDYIMDRDR